MRHLYLILLSFVAQIGTAQNEQLDVTFGDQGRVVTALGVKDDWIWASALQPDGKIVGVGYSTVGFVLRQALVRYMPDGSLDSEFGTGGSYVSTVEREVVGVALHTDGSIITVGTKPNSNFYFGVAVSRFLSNGTPDSTFGTYGSVWTNLGTINDKGKAVAVQSDGRIVVAGTTQTSNNNNDFVLLRYNTDGSLDMTFGTNGVVITAISPGNDNPNTVMLQPDGKILVSGGTNEGSLYSSSLVRYMPNGNLDASFGNGGIVKIENSEGVKALLQPDGRIIAVAREPLNTIPDIFTFRYLANGTPDNTYGVSGKAVTDVQTGVNSAVLQPDGKIVLVGLKQSKFSVARLLTNGDLDPSFGTGGFLTTDASGVNSLNQPHAAHIQQDGKIIVTGSAYKNQKHNMVAVRYLPSNTVSISNAAKEIDLQVYPNPIQDQVTLSYLLAQSASVSIVLIDALGMNRTLLQGTFQPAGKNMVILDIPASLPAGSYFIRVEAGSQHVSIPVMRH